MSDTTVPVYFVTGAAGFVGRAVCHALVLAGSSVHAVVRRHDSDLEQLGVRQWIGDLWDESLVAAAMNGCEYVIHCAGNAAFGNGSHYRRENLELTALVVRQASALTGLKRLVFVSTIGAVDRAANDPMVSPLTPDSPPYPTSDYGKSKLEAEQLLAGSAIPYSIVRPAMVVGSAMRVDSHFSAFARHAIRNSPLAWLAWPGEFSVVHVDDLARAILVLATHPQSVGKTYFCSGDPISLAHYFEMCRARKWRFGLRWVRPLLRPFRKFIPFALKGMLFPALVASDATLRALGWNPEKTPEQALQEVIMREQARHDPELSPSGQTVITGAASGLGRALTERLAPRRKNLLLIDRDAVGLRSLAQKYPQCNILVADLSTDQGVDAVVISEAWRRLPVAELYSCAGLGQRGRMQTVSVADHRRMFQVNVLARVVMTRAAVADMERNHFGRVVLISSSSAFQALPYMTTYAATNSALLSLGEGWGAEVSGDGVSMMTVCPGGMQTNFQDSAGVRKVEGERLMEPSVVADQIMAGLAKNKKTLIVSTRSLAMSLLARVLPRAVSVQLWLRLMEKMR